jgi:hypothetical protein
MMRNNENLSLDACHVVARNGKMNIAIVATTITNSNNHNNFLDQEQENKNIGGEEARGDDTCKFKTQNTKQTNKQNQNPNLNPKPKKITIPNPKRDLKLEVLKKTWSNSDPLLQKEPKTSLDFD